jgi:hypothetical protein
MAGQNTSILTLDYNNIQTKIASILGIGASSTGYGQSLLSTQISSAKTVITGAQWQALRTDLINARTHQTGVDESSNLTNPLPTTYFQGSIIGNVLTVISITSGSIIAGQKVTGAFVPASTRIVGNGTGSGGIGTYTINTTTGNLGATSMTAVLPVQITELDRATYNTYADTITAHKTDAPPAGQATLETYSTATRTSAWNATITNTVTLAWPTANDARYFFNTGSKLQISATMLPDASNLKNNSWQTMLYNMAIISMNYNSTTNTGSGTPSTGIGFYQLTTTPQLIFQKLTQESTYSPNQYDVYASLSLDSTTVILSIQFQDLSTVSGHGFYGLDENVTGTLTSLVQGYRSSGPYVSVLSPSVVSSGLSSTLTTSATISESATRINGGDAVTYTIATTNIPDGTLLYWSNVGTMTAGDFADNSNSGSITVTSNTATLVRTAATSVASSKTIVIQIRNNIGNLLTTAPTVTVKPIVVTVSIASSATSVAAGQTITYVVATTNIPDGTTLNWVNSGTALAAEFNDSLSTDSFEITSNAGTFTRTTVTPLINTRTVIMKIYDETGTVLLATSSTTTVTHS